TSMALRPYVRRLIVAANALQLEEENAVLARVIFEVSNEWRMTPESILGRGRWQPLSLARQSAIVLYRRVSGLGTRAVGQAFGGRDAGTVLHAETSIRNALETDPGFRARFDRCLIALQAPRP
ncbi:MAG: helix-turn-helix domain-containing protein, partial [Limisphaerales bacterium]